MDISANRSIYFNHYTVEAAPVEYLRTQLARMKVDLRNCKRGGYHESVARITSQMQEVEAELKRR